MKTKSFVLTFLTVFFLASCGSLIENKNTSVSIKIPIEEIERRNIQMRSVLLQETVYEVKITLVVNGIPLTQKKQGTKIELSEAVFTFENLAVNSNVVAYAEIFENGILTWKGESNETRLIQGENNIAIKMMAVEKQNTPAEAPEDSSQEDATQNDPPGTEYKITYVLNGGSPVAELPGFYTKETNKIVLSQVAKTGYRFVGWYNDEAYTGDKVTEIPKGSTGDKTFYAKLENVLETDGAYKTLSDYTSPCAPYGSGNWCYLSFGMFPQTEIKTGITVDENKNEKHGDMTYYWGDDENWYAEKDGKYYKVEPIKWRTLTDDYNGNILLLAENILVSMKYGSSINYKDSDIRAYLIGDFYNGAFTENQQNRIEGTMLSDIDSSDKIFLPSRNDIIYTSSSSSYGFLADDLDDSARKKPVTDYNNATEGNNWWTRTEEDSSSVWCVKDDGTANNSENDLDKVYGVVPALCVTP